MFNRYLFIIMLFSANAYGQFTGDWGLNMSFGSNSIRQVQGANGITHDEQTFAVGVGIDTRMGVRINQFVLGAIGFIQWEGARLDYAPDNTSIFSRTSYSITNQRLALGPTVMFYLPGTSFRLLAEYFPTVSNRINWSGEKAENPFTKGDTLSGTGWGLGIGYELMKNISAYSVYRSFNYTEAKISGVTTEIPNSNFLRMSFGGIYAGATLSF